MSGANCVISQETGHSRWVRKAATGATSAGSNPDGKRFTGRRSSRALRLCLTMNGCEYGPVIVGTVRHEARGRDDTTQRSTHDRHQSRPAARRSLRDQRNTAERTSPIRLCPASRACPRLPDVEVVFARGTSEPPGVGGVGQAFVDSVRAQAGPKSVNVYPVNYVASSDFGNRIEFARTVVDGVRDAGLHVEATAANCPNTKIVLGGFSQGAALAGYVTAAEIPEGVPAEYREFIPNPMPSEVAWDWNEFSISAGTPSGISAAVT